MNDRKAQRLFSLTHRLIDASEKRSMHPNADHPWALEVGEKPWLKKKERISIYGTPYWDLASEEEKRLLSIEEVVTWWSGFIAFEQLVSEYYMRVINTGKFHDLPHVEDYMRHFVKEEIVHTIVFKKAIAYFGSEVYELPNEFLRSFYDDNTMSGPYPLMAVYLTMLVEWMADLYQHLDVDADADYIHPLGKAVVLEHWKEEMRHIKWGQNMIVGLAHTDPEFLQAIREFTPIYLRQFVDQGITNIDCFDRIGFQHPAFQDKEKLTEAVLNNEHRRRLNYEVTQPMMAYFVSSGIYDPEYRVFWEQNGFAEDIDNILNKELQSEEA
jgi:hypothetical protein